jgi:hypothetical protein
MERCSQCVLPLKHVKHNRQNICIYCQQKKSPEKSDWEKRKQIFHDIIQSYKGRGKRYDFLVPLTGGRDSTYVLYYLTKVLGASRVLAFTWDQVFHRKLSWTNMASAVAATGVDFQVYRIIDAETTRAIIRAFFRRFGYTCMACRVFLSPVIGGMAIRNEIPLIVTGENPGQAYMRGTHEKSGPVSVLQDVGDRLATVHYLMRRGLEKDMPERMEEIEEETLGCFYRGLRQPEFAWPEYVDMGTYINWYQEDESTFLKTLSDALNFQRGSDTFSHTSCSIERLRGYYEYHFGRIEPTYYSGEISLFVRNGVLNRQQALLELERLGMTDSLPEEAETYCQEIGLTMEDWHRYFGKPLPLSVKAYFVRAAALRRLKSFWHPKK